MNVPQFYFIFVILLEDPHLGLLKNVGACQQWDTPFVLLSKYSNVGWLSKRGTYP